MTQTIVLTGASDGIGAAAARQLTKKGYQVVLVGRSKEKTQKLAAELKAPYHLVDFTRLNDVRRLAEELEQYPRIDVLANNAGGIMGNREVTADGFEKTFQVNHLGPFLLTKLLLPKLLANRAKVIQTSSEASNLFGKTFDITDLNNEKNYSATNAYGNGKLANIYFTRELQARYGDQGISAVAFHPGVVRTSFASETNHFMKFMYHTPLKYLITISPEKSAEAFVKLVEGTPGVDWEPGGVYSKGKPMCVNAFDDGTIAKLLWEKSEDMVASFS
ncbi:SDR family NAD(P)-dependent oxidoreductase [Chryseomicrobium palamuruense]|uniref:SDR family NAD(P)-dependent oxidoreductase n=1 Tax=Chryseomicrobium palamuruense TaxID=682973 RepID=A0ABV8UYA1_9BACL